MKDDTEGYPAALITSTVLHLMLYPWAFAALDCYMAHGWWVIPAYLSLTGFTFWTWIIFAHVLHERWRKKDES